MAKVLVLYYSSYGHIETMANAVAEGARLAEDAARRAITKICEFDKLGSGSVEIGRRKAVVRFTRHITLERSEQSSYTTATCSAYAEHI